MSHNSWHNVSEDGEMQLNQHSLDIYFMQGVVLVVWTESEEGTRPTLKDLTICLQETHV